MTLAGGSFIFLAVLILFLVGVIIALYTRKGSGMDLHPYRHVHGGAPAAALPSNDYSGADRTFVTERNVVRSWRRMRLDQSPAAVAAQVKEARAPNTLSVRPAALATCEALLAQRFFDRHPQAAAACTIAA